MTRYESEDTDRLSFDYHCDSCGEVVTLGENESLPDGWLWVGIESDSGTTGHVCPSCRYLGAEQYLTEQYLKIQVGQDFDAETWHDVKQHFNAGELLTAEIETGNEGEAVLIWTFDLDKAHARKLAVMLEMVAGLGKPQTGLDMKPSKRELWE